MTRTAAPPTRPPEPDGPRQVSKFEFNLLRILRFVLGHYAQDQGLQLVRSSVARPDCLSPGAVDIAKDTLAKACVLFLVRQGGWRNDRYLRDGVPTPGRVWDRVPLEERTLSSSRPVLDFLLWLTSEKVHETKQAWDAAPKALSPADELFFCLAFDHARSDPDVVAVLRKKDTFTRNPLCWITNRFDRSPSELLWVTGDGWGPLKGALLNFSYGYGKIYVVPHEKVEGQMQGGMCRLPIPLLPTGVMRGRFHPGDGQLYACGMYAWAGDRQQPGGFYRIRYTAKQVHVPISLHVEPKGIAITYSGILEPMAAADIQNYALKTWGLMRTAKYGSEHYNEKLLAITAAQLAADGRTIFLEIPAITSTWCMEIRCSIKSADGQSVSSVIHNTIHCTSR